MTFLVRLLCRSFAAVLAEAFRAELSAEAMEWLKAWADSVERGQERDRQAAKLAQIADDASQALFLARDALELVRQRRDRTTGETSEQ